MPRRTAPTAMISSRSTTLAGTGATIDPSSEIRDDRFEIFYVVVFRWGLRSRRIQRYSCVGSPLIDRRNWVPAATVTSLFPQIEQKDCQEHGEENDGGKEVYVLNP